MSDPLAPLLADGVIDEVCGRLKSGKEADLWLVRQGAEIVAAKVYKARQARSFRNDAGYREGRQVRDTRMQRAMDRGSRFGQTAAEEAWKAKEADALHALHAAGVRVPRPVMFYEGVLLMELVVGPDGQPAPRLVDAPIAREHAAALYADLRGQIVRMLGCDLVHGDLSPYNVLLGWNGPVVIDFPQVVGAAHNGQAESYLVRDVENVRRFLAAIDPALHAASGDGREIWRAYARRELTPDFVPTGRAPEATRRGGGRDGGRPSDPGTRRGEVPGGRGPDRSGGRRPGPPGDARHDGRRDGRRERGPDRVGGAPAQRRQDDRRPGPDRGGPERRDRPGDHRPPQASHQGEPRGARPGPGGPRPQRRGAPTPEVVRVVRPPLGPAASGAARPPEPKRPAGSAPAGQQLRPGDTRLQHGPGPHVDVGPGRRRA